MTARTERPRVGGWRVDGYLWVHDTLAVVVYESAFGGWRWYKEGLPPRPTSRPYATSASARHAAERAARK